MFLSAVITTSKPARSASRSRSPLLSVSHPRSFALITVWPGRNRATPCGVTWSNRISIHPRTASSCGWRVETEGRKPEHSVDLFARDVELLDDLVDAGARL